MKHLLIVCIAVIAMSVERVGAQDLASMYSNNVFQQSVIGLGSTTLGAGSGSASPTIRETVITAGSQAFAAPPPATVPTGGLVFSRDPVISREVVEQVTSNTAADADESIQAILDAFHTGEVLNDFDTLQLTRGFSPTDLGDTFVTWLLFNWEVVNGFNPDVGAEAALAVRRQVQLMGQGDDLAALNDAQKQQLSEILAYETMLNGTLYQEILAGNGIVPLEEFQTRMREIVLGRTGLDLHDMPLTNDGLLQG